jgi:hypothetical protein
MEMLNPPQVVTSVIIDEAPLQTSPPQPVSAMDILDGVLEAVASAEAQAQAVVSAPAAPTGNVFNEQYSRYAAAKAAQEQNQAVAKNEDEPVATF